MTFFGWVFGPAGSKKCCWVASNPFPPVRFEHSSRLHKKITTRVDFPEIVDMSPYISHARWKNEFVPYLSLLLHLDFPPNNCILNLLCIEMGKLDLAQITWWQNPTTGKWLIGNKFSWILHKELEHSVFLSRYVLFAVINHIGTLDAGHYTSYIRFVHFHTY